MRTQIITLQLQSGENTKVDPKVLAPGQFTDMQNGTFDVLSAFTKRAGHTPLSKLTAKPQALTSLPLPSMFQLATRGDELIAFDQDTLWSYSPSTQQWSSRASVYYDLDTSGSIIPSSQTYTSQAGALAGTTTTSVPIASSNTSLFSPDHARFGDLELIAWNEGTTATYSIVDRATGTKYYANTAAYAGIGTTYAFPKVLPVTDSNGKTFGIIAAISTTPITFNGHLFNISLVAINMDTGRQDMGVRSPQSNLAQSTISDATISAFQSFDSISSADKVYTAYARWISTQQSQDYRVMPKLACHTKTASDITNTFTIDLLPSNESAAGGSAIGVFETVNNRVNVLFFKASANTGSPIDNGHDLWSCTVDKLSGVSFGAVMLLSGSVDENKTVNTTGTSINVPGDAAAVTGIYNPADGYSYAFYHVSWQQRNTLGSAVVSQNGENDRVRLVKWKQGQPVTSYILAKSIGLISKPFLYDGRVYVWTSYAGIDQPTAFLYRDDGKVVSKGLVNVSAGARVWKTSTQYDASSNTVKTKYQFTPSLASVVVSADGQSFQLSVEKQGSLLGYALDKDENSPIRAVTATALAQLKTTFGGPSLNYLEFNANTYLHGSQLHLYDSNSVTELGFHLYPDEKAPLLTSSVGTAGQIASGSYLYSFTYHWKDSNSIEWSSRPSTPVELTLPANSSKVTWSVPSLRVTNKTNAYIKGWRTNELSKGEGTADVFQQFTDLTNVTPNNAAADTTTLIDAISDTNLQSRPVLYTVSGELENSPVPVAKAICSWDNRLVLAGDESDPLKVWIGKQATESSPPSFNDALYIRVADESFPVTAVGTVDDKLIIFKQRYMYMLFGGGPDNLGAGAFNAVQRISSDIGCDQPKSLVSAGSQGLFFKSTKGFYRLGTDLSITPVGLPVESKVKDEVISSAVLVPEQHQIRWTCSSSGNIYVYDYELDRWTTHTGMGPIIDSVIWQGQHTLLTADQKFLVETDQAYQDDQSTIVTSLTTGWVSFQGSLTGTQRVFCLWLLGEAKSSHTLKVEIAFDYIDQWKETYTVASADVVAPGIDGDNPMIAGIKITRQNCMAFRLRISDMNVQPPSVTGQPAGLQLTAIAAQVGVQDGRFPLKTTSFAI